MKCKEGTVQVSNMKHMLAEAKEYKLMEWNG
jgi:hypothetical protein